MFRLLSLCVLAAVAAALPAAEPLRVPTFNIEPTPAPGVEPIATSMPVIVAKQPLPVIDQVSEQLAPIPMQVTQPQTVIALYHNVKVRTPGRMDPCAVPQIIQVPNPCRGCCDPVFVKVCVPPCKSPCMTVGRFGRITYDFGKYRVQVASRNGLVIVDYDA
jgi:hypothetical protein